jgi:hypothetical protein
MLTGAQMRARETAPPQCRSASPTNPNGGRAGSPEEEGSARNPIAAIVVIKRVCPTLKKGGMRFAFSPYTSSHKPPRGPPSTRSGLQSRWQAWEGGGRPFRRQHSERYPLLPLGIKSRMAPSESPAPAASKFSTVARWIVAILAAILAFIVGVLMKGFAYKGVGPTVIQTWLVAAILGAFAGIIISPARHQKAARYIFIGMPVAVAVILLLHSVVEHRFEATNQLEEVVGSIIGGLIVWRINRGQWRL